MIDTALLRAQLGNQSVILTAAGNGTLNSNNNTLNNDEAAVYPSVCD